MVPNPRRYPYRHILVAAVLAGSATTVSVRAQQNQPAKTSAPASAQHPRGTPAADATAENPAIDPMTLWTGGRYRLTQSDVLDLHFPYVPEFDQTVTVEPDGYISLRGVGDVYAQGRSLPELKAVLTETYAPILRDPVINVVLKEFEKPYFVAAGELAHPGKFELRGATTLTQGIALAGGQTRDAKHSQVILFRRFVGEWLEVKEINVQKMYDSHDLSEDPLLRPGDTIFIPRNTISKIAPYIPKPSLGLYFNPFP